MPINPRPVDHEPEAEEERKQIELNNDLTEYANYIGLIGMQSASQRLLSSLNQSPVSDLCTTVVTTGLGADMELDLFPSFPPSNGRQQLQKASSFDSLLSLLMSQQASQVEENFPCNSLVETHREIFPVKFTPNPTNPDLLNRPTVTGSSEGSGSR